MSKIYEAACQLVGKGPEDSAFDELAEVVGEYPLIVASDNEIGRYKYTNAGITLIFNESDKCFSNALFDNTSGNRSLPAQIEWGEAPDVVEQKLANSPQSSKLTNEPYEDKILSETYTLTDHLLVRFDFKKGLCSMAISQAPATDSTSLTVLSRNVLADNRRYWKEL